MLLSFGGGWPLKDTIMKLLYTHENLFVLTNIRNLVEAEGIATEVKNQYLSGATGDVPALDAWPELWVLDEAQFPQAQSICQAILNAQEGDSPEWDCRACGEKNGSQFELCWACGELRVD